MFNKLKEKFLSQLSLIILIISIIAFLIFGYRGLSTYKHTKTDYWENYWTALTIIGSLLATNIQIIIVKRDKKRNGFVEMQRELGEKYEPVFVDFFTEEYDKYYLAKKLISLINVSISMEIRRKLLKLNENEYRYYTYLNYFNANIEKIIYNPDNIKIIEIVSEVYSEYDTDMEIVKYIKLQKSHSYNEIIKNRISGAWIISANSAIKAKYLIGVSVNKNGNKQVLGAYELSKNKDNKISIDDDTGRVTFNDLTTLYPRKDDHSNNIIYTLDGWSTQNPVLYFKNYVKKSDNDSVNDKSADEDLKSIHINDYNELGDKDIIVVKITNIDL